MEGFRVKRCETLVEDHKVSILEKRPGDVEATPFAMGKLPTSLADHLLQSGWHAVQEVPKAQLRGTGLSACCTSSGCAWPAASHQQIEGEGSREDVVCGLPALPPRATASPRLRALANRDPGGGGGQTAASANQRGGRPRGNLASAGRAFEENAVTCADLQAACPEHRLNASVVAENHILRASRTGCPFSLSPERELSGRRQRPAGHSPPGGPPRGRRG